MATLKYSRQRESIKEFLRTRKDHPTADVVYENMKLIYPSADGSGFILSFNSPKSRIASKCCAITLQL